MDGMSIWGCSACVSRFLHTTRLVDEVDGASIEREAFPGVKGVAGKKHHRPTHAGLAQLAGRSESFSALLDETRCKAAKHYLEETDMRIAQVAYMAGYTEAAALVRAFKRWTGATPMQFRDAAGRSTRPPS
jgi:AraC-like DNA-binding protein